MLFGVQICLNYSLRKMSEKYVLPEFGSASDSEDDFGSLTKYEEPEVN